MKALKVLGGAVAGAVVGAVSTPGYMVGDCIAPISYPVMGAVGGACVCESMHGNPVVGAVLGGMVGVACIPLAPFNFVQRPFTPAAFAVLGGIAAHQVS